MARSDSTLDAAQLRRMSLTTDEMEQVERIFLHHIDEDDAMSILQDLVSARFFIFSERGLNEVIRRTAEQATGARHE